MLKAGVRVSDVTWYHNCHPSAKQRPRDRYKATGELKIDAGLVSQDWRQALRRLCIDGIYIDDIRSSQLLALPDK